jgi:hypothetical protein
LRKIVILLLFVIANHYATLHQLVLEPSNFPAMVQRKRDGGNTYASFGVMHERKETPRDERLAIRSQHVEEKFVAQSRQLMEQIRALSDQLDAMDGANGRCRQPTPRFVDEDDVVTFSQA